MINGQYVARSYGTIKLLLASIEQISKDCNLECFNEEQLDSSIKFCAEKFNVKKEDVSIKVISFIDFE